MTSTPLIFLRMQGSHIGGVPVTGTPLIFQISVAYRNVSTPLIYLPEIIDMWSTYWWRTHNWYATDISDISGVQDCWYATNNMEHIYKCGQPHLPSHFPLPTLISTLSLFPPHFYHLPH